MTHILVDPCFPHHLSKYVDSQLVPSRSRSGKLTRGEFENIRSRSRQSWSGLLDFQDDDQNDQRYRTTYSAYHNEKQADEKVRSRPTSATRKNNPHPPMPFLIWHLHNVPGFDKRKVYPSDQSPYKVGYREEKRPIDQQKLVYHSVPDLRPRTGNSNQILQATIADESLPKAKAWIQQASNKDKSVVLDMLKSCADQRYVEKRIDDMAKPEVRASLHRYLKKAGREEQDAMVRLFKTLSFDPYKAEHIDRKLIGKQDPGRYTLRKYTEKEPINARYETEQVVVRKFPYRRDFKLHPEWIP